MTLIASVVIPALNASGTIDDQLAALASQVDAPAFEVIVADNGSTDGTAQRALAWRGRLDISVVDASQRRGVSHARNIGIAHAASPLVLFCDADDTVVPRWVRAMVDALAMDDLVGGPLITSRINSMSTITRSQSHDQHELPTALRHLPYATGGNLGVRRDWARRLQGFDTSYQGGHEEVDFAWRLQDEGGTLGWAPHAEVDYRLRDETRSLVKQRFRYGRTSAQVQRHFDRPGMPPLTVRRQVRILLSHLTDLPSHLRDRDAFVSWLGGLGWSVGRLVGFVTPLPPRELTDLGDRS